MRRLRACVPHPASAQAGRALRPSAGSRPCPRCPSARFPRPLLGAQAGPAQPPLPVKSLRSWQRSHGNCGAATKRPGGRWPRPRRGFLASQLPVGMCCDTGVSPGGQGPQVCARPVQPLPSPARILSWASPRGSDSQWRAGPACDPGPPTALLINLAGFSSVILVHSFTNIHSANLGPTLCRALGLHDKACAAVKRAFIKCLLCAESCAGADTGTQQRWRHTWFLPLQRWQSSGGERLRGDPPGGAVRRRRPGVLLGGGGMGVQAAVQGPGPALL